MRQLFRRWSWARLAKRRSATEAGYVAVVFTMVIASGLFLGAAAIAVDTGRWYSEMEKVQKAADAGALAGVPYLPYDMASATRVAREAVRRNGFATLTDQQIKVRHGAVDSQLKVTVSTSVENAWGAGFGVNSATVSRSAVADYKAAAPMGSPCNVFGNEPAAGTSATATDKALASPLPIGTVRDTALPNCTSNPQLWGGVQGAKSNKSNGDRYQNEYCSDATGYRCTPNLNDEYREDGYFWVIQVTPEAVGQQIDLQVYDGAYINTGSFACGSLPQSSSLSNNMNSYVTTDGKDRYARTPRSTYTGPPFCSGDTLAGAHAGGTYADPVTSFAVRRPTESLNPKAGVEITDCTTQLRGTTSVPTVGRLTGTNSSYNRQLAQLFHNWYSLCSFTATEPGDYFIQVRTNVAFGGNQVANNGSNSSMISKRNPAVLGDAGTYRNTAFTNTFSLRAAAPGFQKYVSVSGYDAMPMFANTNDAVSEFHLIRVLPGAAGQFVTFSFFDVADSDGASGNVQVFTPSDAKTTAGTALPINPVGCTSKLGDAGTTLALTSCRAGVTNAANNGNLQTITIPIPTDYECDYKAPTGCWYKVKVSLGGDGVRDFTTWSATIVGDPVRLIQ